MFLLCSYYILGVPSLGFPVKSPFTVWGTSTMPQMILIIVLGFIRDLGVLGFRGIGI